MSFETNLDANGQIFSNANNAATQAYMKSKMSNENEQLALQKAQFAWKQTLDTASMTGLFQGAPTQQAMQYYANTFGDWSTPEAGAKTLQAQQQQFQQGVTTAGLTGTYNGQQTQAAQKQAADMAAQAAGFTGQFGGQQTQQAQQQAWQQGFSQQQQNDKNRQDYLQLLSGLRGPADYGQYLKVLGSTPNGLQDLVAAASGQYQPGTGSSGQGPVPVSLGSFMNSAATGMGQQYAAGQQPQGGYQPGSYVYPQSGPQQAGYGQPGPAQTQQWGVQPGESMQHLAVMPGSTGPQRTPYQQAQGAQQTVYGQQQQAAQGANPYTQGSPAGNNMQPAATGTAYDQYMQQASNLPPPNQISPQAYNNMTTTQRQMLGGMYEQGGYALPDVADMYKQSLPKYGASRPQTGAIKLA